MLHDADKIIDFCESLPGILFVSWSRRILGQDAKVENIADNSDPIDNRKKSTVFEASNNPKVMRRVGIIEKPSSYVLEKINDLADTVHIELNAEAAKMEPKYKKTSDLVAKCADLIRDGVHVYFTYI